MTADEAIAILNGAQAMVLNRNPDKFVEAVNRAILALDAERQRKNPKPLTIEELQHMNDQPVYVVPLPDSGRDSSWAEWCVMGNDEAFIPGIEYWHWKLTDYNQTWTAYRYKPKEGQQ